MDASNPLRLINLDVNCLREIFKYLDTSDIVILTKANLTGNENLDKIFVPQQNTTIHPYEACIQNRFLQLGYNDCITNNPHCVSFERRVFRYFGKLLSEVRLYFDPNFQRYNAHIEQVILDYGHGQSLVTMELINADTCAFDNIKKPFHNVTTLKFVNGWVGTKCLELCKWFPNLRSLTLNGTKICNGRFMKQELSNLIELSVRNKHLCRCYRMNLNMFSNNILDYVVSNLQLKRFLHLNSQLRYLTLFHDPEDAIFEQNKQPNHFLIQINCDLLKFIANNLLKLNFLRLNITEIRPLHVPTYLTAFLQLKTLVVEVSDIKQLSQVNITTNELHGLGLTIHTPFTDYKVLCTFVSRFKTIESLSIDHHPLDLQDKDLVYLMENLTNLKTLRIALYEDKFSHDLFYIINKFDRLNAVRIHCFFDDRTNKQTFLKFVNESIILKSRNWRGSWIGNECVFRKY